MQEPFLINLVHVLLINKDSYTAIHKPFFGGKHSLSLWKAAALDALAIELRETD